MITQENNKIMVNPIDISTVDHDRKEVSAIVRGANELIINNQATYDGAGSFLKGIRSLTKAIDEKRKELTSPLDQVKKSIMALFNPMTDELKKADEIVEQKRISWSNEQLKIQQKLEEEARLKAKAIEDKRKKDLEEQAKKWEEKGNLEKAEERRLAAQEVFVPPPPIAATIQKTQGISVTTRWYGEVTNMKALIEFIQKGYASIELVQPNESAINQLAMSSKGKLTIPGLKFYSKQFESARR